MQARAAEDLKRLVTGSLVEAGLTYAHAGAFAGPRRLTLSLTGVAARTPDTREERKGPRADAPEKAIEGFLRSTGLGRDALEERPDKKGTVLFAVIDRPGRAAPAVVAEAVEAAVRGFPWPKSMRWGAGRLRWVRPLRSILCILSDEAGAEIVPLEIDGIRAGDTTVGHRVHAPEPFAVSGFEDYAAKLKAAHVLLDPAERRDLIEHEAGQRAFAAGMELVPDRALLDEVAGLVEWPVPLMGEIAPDFLDLPAEVLQTSMREHQKFFSVRNPATGRIERFVTVANLVAPDGGAAILAGNLRVLAARLSDAKFFWENDLRKVAGRGEPGMAEMSAPLANVVFHAKLGTQAERIARVARLAAEIAPAVGADAGQAAQAARVAKADLASEMVYEFPELQGVMGRYYAEAAGLAGPVAQAAEEHYRPLGPSDAVPTAPVSQAVALADKIDTLTGFWAIGEKPTGSKDPFALRRAALGIIRILLETGQRRPLFQIAIHAFNRHIEEIARRDRSLLISETDLAAALADVEEDIVAAASRVLAERVEAAEEEARHHTGMSLVAMLDLMRFFEDRLKVFLRDRGIRHDVIDAVAARPDWDVLALRVAKAEALQGFLDTEDGANLLAGYRRASNILAKEEEKDGVEYSGAPEIRFAEQAEERALFAALDAAEPAIAAALAAEDFASAMGEMARLRAPVDAFFEAVLVNAENRIVRRNRLCLLSRVRQAMRQVAIWDAIEGGA
ncbi:glycine--tRNA ligase subunit beta [Paralimibaculum aggregatum]|uniref:Glycine--tRNA ligase beta subunit n=2 Tax=Paralimibaculum aggregatum TaxID=3036245 RepID=A0ABQ6LKF7_9RHOB|nr:glycine--tRNA ligase subunit beta [Limibaculum sp. NKW23]